MAGTRFRIYLQTPVIGAPFDVPQVVTVNRPPAQIAEGPTDVDTGTGEPLLRVVDAIKRRFDNRTPYGFMPFDARPWGGACHAPATPGREGHFDHLDPETQPRQFAQAAVYASIRFTLERWQGYLKKVRRGGLRWHHRPQKAGVDSHLELYPWVRSTGARAGYGFIELGHGPVAVGRRASSAPLWKNFDVIAHEFGHSMLFSMLGFPRGLSKGAAWYSPQSRRRHGYFLAFHESACDLVAMVASMHHEQVAAHLLRRTRGDLRKGGNIISRVGELKRAAPDDLGTLVSIRNAANALTLDKLSVDKHSPHLFSLPLTGAIYDVLVDVYEDKLHTRNFEEALAAARDYLGELLARAWGNYQVPYALDYSRVLRALHAADRDMGGDYGEAIIGRFAARGIN